MPVNFAVGGSTYMTKHPRVVFTQDGRGGCPPASGGGATFYTTTVTTTAPCIILVSTSMIRYWLVGGQSSRCDLGIRVDGLGFSGEAGRNLQYADSGSEWQTDKMYHAFATSNTGTVNISTFDATGGFCGNSWGCGTTWGGQTVMIFE
jgi:hypothetical protein